MSILFKSKKFIMSVFGMVAVLVGHFYAPGEDLVMQIAGIVVAYIIGQGISDSGKEAAKITKG